MSAEYVVAITSENLRVLASPQVAEAIASGAIKTFGTVARCGETGEIVKHLKLVNDTAKEVAKSPPSELGPVVIVLAGGVLLIAGTYAAVQYVDSQQKEPVKRQLKRAAQAIIKFDQEVRDRGIRLDSVKTTTEVLEKLHRRLERAKKDGLSVSSKDKNCSVFEAFHHNLIDIHSQLKEGQTVRFGDIPNLPDLELPLTQGSDSKKFRSLVSAICQALRQIEVLMQPATVAT